MGNAPWILVTLKSYSSRMPSAGFVCIASSLASTGFPGRNNADLLCAGVGIDDDEEPARQVRSEGDKALFVMFWIGNGDGARIIKDRRGISKGNSMRP